MKTKINTAAAALVAVASLVLLPATASAQEEGGPVSEGHGISSGQISSLQP
ncbi:hypothetical protein [Psychromicrobium sp. YIM B11713]|uniref:hypothetical protein n=1 Tax=Psychromicrobium sp. YIM B11713 TaxID=3145233 RepID=UPI00374EBA61